MEWIVSVVRTNGVGKEFVGRRDRWRAAGKGSVQGVEAQLALW